MKEIPRVYCEVRNNPYSVYIQFLLEMVIGDYNIKHLQKCNIYISQSCKLATVSGDGYNDPVRRRI
jgi:hypothetical protein